MISPLGPPAVKNNDSKPLSSKRQLIYANSYMIKTADLIRKIHDAPHQGVLAVAGAGSQAVAWLLGVGGASRTLLEVVVPYGRLSMIDLVGFEPEQFVSETTALSMAKAAFHRAERLLEGDFPAVGLACTATIATDRPKRGEHRGFIATWDVNGWNTYSLLLTKGHRDRAGEEALLSNLLVRALAHISQVDYSPVENEGDIGLGLGLIDTDDLQVESGAHASPLQRLIAGDIDTVKVDQDGNLGRGQTPGALSIPGLLPGSFNPWHSGHIGMVQAAQEILGTEVIYELSVTNVDKLPLAEEEITRRLAQFKGQASVVLTRAETYWKKARLFPGCTFVIGWDTAIRLVAPRYYGDDEAAMFKALAQIWAGDCSFLVAGREEGGAFRTLDDVLVPQGFRPMFRAIPESAFRIDISSTSLRSGG